MALSPISLSFLSFIYPSGICSPFALSFRHRDRDCLAGAAFGDPDRVARGLNCGRCLESVLDYRDARLIAIDGNNGNLAAAILSEKQLAIGCAHAVRPFHGLIQRDLDRLPGFAGSVHRDTVELAR